MLIYDTILEMTDQNKVLYKASKYCQTKNLFILEIQYEHISVNCLEIF